MSTYEEIVDKGEPPLVILARSPPEDLVSWVEFNHPQTGELVRIYDTNRLPGAAISLSYAPAFPWMKCQKCGKKITLFRDTDFVGRTVCPGCASPKPVKNHLTAKVGRNEPCPCGSGKKFKNCHLRNPDEIPG